MITKASGRKLCPPATPQTKLKFIGVEKMRCFINSRMLSSPPTS